MIPVAIIGDGYTAADLLRLLAGHGEAVAVRIGSTENVGRPVAEVYPHLAGFTDLVCEETDLEAWGKECQAAFLALPHGLSVPIAQRLLRGGVRCIDLGADFRLKDAALYQRFYEMEHAAPELLETAVYGLPEVHRPLIATADVVANPGCFPTGAILALAPALRAGLVEASGIVVDSKTGVSGAGRVPKPASHYCEVNEGVRAYGVGSHRHAPEIAQELSLLAGRKVDMDFTPHLVPMSRGILTTVYAHLVGGTSARQVREAYLDYYQGEPFVRVLPEGVFPHTRWVYGSNMVDIGLYVDQERGRLIALSAIDNLVKGASGQALQNFNLMFGLEETQGLKFSGIFP